jgi:hypothetical protein
MNGDAAISLAFFLYISSVAFITASMGPDAKGHVHGLHAAHQL